MRILYIQSVLNGRRLVHIDKINIKLAWQEINTDNQTLTWI
jgi:hypothetical protein